MEPQNLNFDWFILPTRLIFFTNKVKKRLDHTVGVSHVGKFGLDMRYYLKDYTFRLGDAYTFIEVGHCWFR